jgi:hypothetical protein
VPVVGPWLTLATRDGCRDADYSYEDGDCRAVRTLLIMDAVAQTTGAVLFVWGVTSPVKRLVRTEAWAVSPGHVGSGYGVVARAQF